MRTGGARQVATAGLGAEPKKLVERESIAGFAEPRGIELDETRRITAFPSSAIESARALAGAAIERAVQGDAAGAQAALEGVSVVLEAMSDDDVEAARVNILVGEALLALREPEKARERFERAFLLLLANEQRAESARAVLGVARALQMLGDARSRNAFEYAEILFGTSAAGAPKSPKPTS